jgi:two-component system, LuxR family, response regulator FixJ
VEIRFLLRRGRGCPHASSLTFKCRADPASTFLELNAQNYGAPIFIISDQGDISVAVDAIKNGALDFIEKPFDANAVVARVRDGIDAWARRGVMARTNRFLSADFSHRDRLTPRELEMLALIASGAMKKKSGQP